VDNDGMTTPAALPPDPAALPLPAGLYVVALPLGNPRDITLRALDTLQGVDVIAAEDTRDFARLARLYAIATPVVSYHDFNEQSRAAQLVARMAAGARVALVSDAGTPLVSDPGYRLVAAAIAANLPVTSLPGPCAFVTALAACGLPVNQALFLGFPPRAAGARRAAFARLATEPATLVLYEAPHRLVATLTDLRAALGERPACLARNLTKRHELYQRGSLSELLAQLAAEGDVRGEATLIVSGAPPDAGHAERVADAAEDARRLLAEGHDAKSAQAQLMRDHGLTRRAAYALVLDAKQTPGDDERA
jgi:16S rRNA (cytidine1402-2'-O)-methyltransferase